MANLRQQIAASESVRSKFLSGKPFTEEDVRMELAPSTDLRKQLDEAMQLILALTAANKRLRAQMKGHEFSFSGDGSSYVHNDDCELCAIEEDK